VALRKRFRAFGRGTIEILSPDNPKVLAFLRESADETLLVVVNLSRYPQWVELGLEEFSGRAPVELLGNGLFPAIESTPYRLTLGGRGGLWFSLSEGLERQRGTLLASPLVSRVGEHQGPREDVFEAGSGLETVLAAFVPAQRWFRSKSRAVVGTRVLDALELPTDNAVPGLDALWLTFVEFQFSEGEPETYALPLETLREAALAALYLWLHPWLGGSDGAGWPFGRPVTLGDVHAALSDVEGLDYVEDARLYPANPTTGTRQDAAQRVDIGPDMLPFSYDHQIQVVTRS